MIPDIFQILQNTPAVTNLLGYNPMKLYPWQEAPQKVTMPYATYGVYNGNPQNMLDRVPLIDNLGTQIDVWAATTDSCINVATAIRNALEPHGHMTAIENIERDPETRAYRCRMDFDFFTYR